MSVGLSEFSEEKMKTYREGNKKKITIKPII